MPEHPNRIDRMTDELSQILVDQLVDGEPNEDAELMLQLVDLEQNPTQMVREADMIFRTFEEYTGPSIAGDGIVLVMGALLSHDPSFMPRMEPFATHQSEVVRARFCHAMGYCEQVAIQVGFGEHVKSLASDTEAVVRRRAIQALVRLARKGLEGTEDLLKRALSDDDPEVRNYAGGDVP